MLSPRELMDVALKTSVVPVLRESGFTGSYPHLRRVHVTHVDLLTFQFDVNGGGFQIEISRCGIGGTTTHWVSTFRRLMSQLGTFTPTIGFA
jgi:Domain of unknown function (DUF4304)